MARRATRRTSRSRARTSRPASRSTRRVAGRGRTYARAPARRSRGRSAPARQQRIVIEFAGAAPVRETGLGLNVKQAPAPRLKPKL